MTAPTRPACRCRHGALAHEMDGLAPQCSAPGCPCLQYRPLGGPNVRPAERPGSAHTPPSPLQPKPRIVIDTDVNEPNETPEKLDRQPDAPTKLASPVEGIDVHFLLREAKTRTARIQARAEKIAELLTELRDLVAADSEAAAARKEIADLEAALRNAKAKLAGKKPAEPTPIKAAPEPAAKTFACPDCDKVCSTAQGLAAHRRITHGYSKAKAS